MQYDIFGFFKDGLSGRVGGARILCNHSASSRRVWPAQRALTWRVCSLRMLPRLAGLKRDCWLMVVAVNSRHSVHAVPTLPLVVWRILGSRHIFLGAFLLALT